MGKHKPIHASAGEPRICQEHAYGGNVPGAPSAPLEGVILAGVHRWGASALDQVISRPLLPVVGWPIIVHTLRWLQRGGVNSVAICANSDTKHLCRWLGSGSAFQMKVNYYVDMTPRGPAGCVRDAVLDREARAFVVIEGAVLPQIDLNDVLRKHEESNAILTVVLLRIPCENHVGQDLFKPAGIYIFAPQALAHIPTKGYQDIKEKLILRLFTEGENIASYVVNHDAVLQVIDTATYLSVNQCLLGQMARWGICPADYIRHKLALVHKSAKVSSRARLIGPVLVEPTCVVEDQVIVVGPSILGMGSHVDRSAVVSRSVLWRDCRVHSQARLDHCILTDQASVAGHTALRNMVCIGDNLDHTPAWLASSEASWDLASVKMTDSVWEAGGSKQRKFDRAGVYPSRIAQKGLVDNHWPLAPPHVP